MTRFHVWLDNNGEEFDRDEPPDFTTDTVSPSRAALEFYNRSLDDDFAARLIVQDTGSGDYYTVAVVRPDAVVDECRKATIEELTGDAPAVQP